MLDFSCASRYSGACAPSVGSASLFSCRFRIRAGNPDPPGQNWGWDAGGPDAPVGLKGSVAGGFLMGAGGALRWRAGANGGALRRTAAALVAGIGAAQDKSDGYLMAFGKNVSHFKENPDYVTSWLTHGLLEVAVAMPSSGALSMLRKHFDWFNSAEGLPLFLPPARPGQWTTDTDFFTKKPYQVLKNCSAPCYSLLCTFGDNSLLRLILE